MGRRGNMRSRPGLLFIIIFAVCLVIVYLSWRSMSPGIKVKDTYSVQMQNLLDESSKWRNAGDNREGENHDKENNNREVNDRDPDYDLENVHHKKVGVAPALHQYEKADDKENKQDFKEHQTDPKTPEALEIDKKLYRQPNDLIIKTIKSMERFVHLDLKGAALKISYFKDFIRLVKKLGATGLLIEYEDMFPYTGMLKPIRAKNAYSLDDIKELLGLAKVNNLEVIPLIQTFGHMEFVLKSVFNNLRESSYTPQVIDITQNASYSLISEMVKQILSAHPDATHLHIGCDEVYELGKGASALEIQSKKLTETQLFLRHVQKVAAIVRRYNGRDVIPIIWDDELRKTPLKEIENSGLPSQVEIMVWHYTQQVLEIITSEIWDKYAKLFKSVWIASAFKGATGARQLFTEPQYHIQNHFSWLNAIAANNQRVIFKGIALTGWQRYDHFATLCELLPVAIPSLAVCLATMVNAGFTKEIHMTTSKLLQCSAPIEMTFPQIDKKTNTAIVSQDCRFPGHELYHAVQELYGYIEGMPSIKHRQDGWLSDYQLTHKFSSPGQLRVLSKSLTEQNSGLSMVSNPLKRLLATIYFDDTVDEWMNENIIEKQQHNTELQEKILSFELKKTWPQRPLPVDIDSKIMSTLNETGDNNNFQDSRNDQKRNEQNAQNRNNNFQDSRNDQKRNEQNAQNRNNNFQDSRNDQKRNEQIAQNRNDEYHVKKNPYIKSSPELKPQPVIPFSAPLPLNNFKIQNENPQHEENGGDNFVAGKEDLHRLPNWKPSKEEQRENRRRSEVLLENENEKLKKYNDNQRQQSNKIDGSKIDTGEFKPEIYKPTEARGIKISQLPDDLSIYRKMEEDDKMRREKYFQKDKNDIAAEKEESVLKYSKSFDGKEQQRVKPDNAYNLLKERFKIPLDNTKEFAVLKQK